MEKHFIEPPLFKIDEGYNNSTKDTPIILIITPDLDPLADLKKFSEKKWAKTSNKSHHWVEIRVSRQHQCSKKFPKTEPGYCFKILICILMQ